MAEKRKGMKPLYMNEEECPLEPEQPEYTECEMNEEPAMEECTMEEEPTADYNDCEYEEEEYEECEEEETEECEEEESLNPCCYTEPALDYLREAIVGELDAINYYEKIMMKIPDCRVQQAICGILNDERNHFAHHLYLLGRYDPVQAKEFSAAGWKRPGKNMDHTRHGNLTHANPQQAMQHLMDHMMEKVEECVMEFMEENMDEDTLANIFDNLPYQMRKFLEDHLDDENLMESLTPKIKEDLVNHIRRGLPQQLFSDLLQYVVQCCARHMERVLQQHAYGPMNPQMRDQIMHCCQSYVNDCIFYYILDYILSRLDDIIEGEMEVEDEMDTDMEESTECKMEDYEIENDCPTEESTNQYQDCPTDKPSYHTNNHNHGQYASDMDYTDCPKGQSEADCCPCTPPWLALIRKAITDELKAINSYRMYILNTPQADIRDSFCAAMNTEKEHVATLTRILRKCDLAQAEELAFFGWKMPKKNY